MARRKGDITFSEYTARMVKGAVEYQAEFQTTFDFSLSLFWNNLTGFDVVGFEARLIHSRENESVKGAITRQYGKKAARLVEKLLKLTGFKEGDVK